MTERSSGGADRRRHWTVDVLIGGSLALGVITVAHAALPRPDPHPPRRLSLLAARLPASPPAGASLSASAPAPPAPAPPPALIAFQAPLPGATVGSPFGYRQLPWEQRPRLHAGIDLEAAAGTPIRAAADGVVTRVGVDPGYGRFVELKHAAGLVTRYGHMGPFLPGVAVGAAVKAGAPVGQIGSSGASTGAHLHFEIRDAQNRPLNPELFLGRRFAAARELPLRQALRAPRAIRLAYVSIIPASKRAAMDARRAESAAGATGGAADSAEGAAVNASLTQDAGGRLHARYAVAK